MLQYFSDGATLTLNLYNDIFPLSCGLTDTNLSTPPVVACWGAVVSILSVGEGHNVRL